jgi:hypothetical protein
MKRLIMTLFFISLLFVSGSALAPKKAHCVYCPTFACYGNCGFSGCTCMSRGSGQGGECVSFNVKLIEDMKNGGWIELK